MLQPHYVNRTGNGRYMGYIPDLMSALSAAIGFQYTLHVVEDGNYGNKRSGDTWDGMIGELLRNVILILFFVSMYTIFHQPFVKLIHLFIKNTHEVLFDNDSTRLYPPVSAKTSPVSFDDVIRAFLSMRSGNAHASRGHFFVSRLS